MNYKLCGRGVRLRYVYNLWRHWMKRHAFRGRIIFSPTDNRRNLCENLAVFETVPGRGRGRLPFTGGEMSATLTEGYGSGRPPNGGGRGEKITTDYITVQNFCLYSSFIIHSPQGVIYPPRPERLRF